MATSTTNYNFIKPESTDTSEIITDLNTNYDSIDTELYKKADKDSDAVENNLAKFDADGNPVDSGIASNTVPIATTANLTFYVNPSTGNDNNNGSSGSPFATIAKAISLIPQVVNHAVTINVADGSYSEGITLSGYVGRASITIVGNDSHPENVIFSGQVLVSYTANYIYIHGLESTYTTSYAFYCLRCSGQVYFYCVLCDTTAAQAGLRAFACPSVMVANSIFSNRSSGIEATTCSRVYSAVNGGTDNTSGLAAIAATIMKNGTQPAGTTAESTDRGGVIR